MFGQPTVFYSPDAGSSTEVEHPLGAVVLGAQAVVATKGDAHDGMLQVYGV